MDNDKKNRWYDKYPDLAELFNKIKIKKESERNVIILDIKKIIMTHDPEIINRNVMNFPLPLKRRWYDKDPYSWTVINVLKYVEEKIINEIINFLKEKL